MNKKITIIIICFICISVFSMLYYIVNEIKNSKLELSYLPNIPLYRLDDTIYEIADNGSPILLFFFKTSCYYCIEEAQQIIEYILEFSCTQIFFISSEKLQIIEEFSNQLACEEIEFLQDKGGKLFEKLNIKLSPTILIYSKDKKFVSRFSGIVPIEQVIIELPND